MDDHSFVAISRHISHDASHSRLHTFVFSVINPFFLLLLTQAPNSLSRFFQPLKIHFFGSHQHGLLLSDTAIRLSQELKTSLQNSLGIEPGNPGQHYLGPCVNRL
jgi:hypothetical protein